MKSLEGNFFLKKQLITSIVTQAKALLSGNYYMQLHELKTN
jgi:hypothetical protein